jgi:hypothetical protein
LLLVNKAFYACAQRLHNRDQHFVIRQEVGDSETKKTAKIISALLYDTSRESDYFPADPFNRKHYSSWLENIYSFLLYQKRVNKTVPLREVHIKLGEWERQPSMGLAAGWECFERRNKRCFI